jgi:hypothetical protein
MFWRLAVIILIIILAAIAVFFAVGKISETLRRDQLPREYSIDVVEDLRALGYSGQRKIATDKMGNIFVAYRKKHQSRSEIFVARLSGSGTAKILREAEKPIAVIGSAEQRVPSIAVDSKGTVHSVWYGSNAADRPDNRQIKYARSLDQGASWSAWRNISYVSGFTENQELWQEHPMLLAGKEDTLYIVWEGKDEQNKNQQIKFAKSENGGNSWSAWKNVRAAKNAPQSRPSLVEGQDGKLYLFMYSSEGSANGLQQIRCAISADRGETWSSWQMISDARLDARHASAAVDAGGKIHLVWRSPAKAGGPAQIFYRSLEGGRWTPARIVSPSENYQFFPSIGADDRGNAVITWMETPEAFDFPRENPQSGSGRVVFLKDGVFQNKIQLGESGRVFYPSLPERIENLDAVPIVYSLQEDEDKLTIKINFTEGN